MKIWIYSLDLTYEHWTPYGWLIWILSLGRVARRKALLKVTHFSAFSSNWPTKLTDFKHFLAIYAGEMERNLCLTLNEWYVYMHCKFVKTIGHSTELLLLGWRWIEFKYWWVTSEFFLLFFCRIYACFRGDFEWSICNKFDMHSLRRDIWNYESQQEIFINIQHTTKTLADQSGKRSKPSRITIIPTNSNYWTIIIHCFSLKRIQIYAEPRMKQQRW